jgi:hypothetical protein
MTVDLAYRQTLADMKRVAVRDFALMKRTLELQIDLKINEGLGAHLAVQSTIRWRSEDIGYDRLSVPREWRACCWRPSSSTTLPLARPSTSRLRRWTLADAIWKYGGLIRTQSK